MSRRDPILLLEDVLDSIRKIRTYTSDTSFDQFLADEKTQDAVVRNFEVIGEAVNQLPESFVASNSHIEWRKIVAVRNRVIHEYFGVDLAIIWSIVQVDLPEFEQAIEKLVSAR